MICCEKYFLQDLLVGWWCWTKETIALTQSHINYLACCTNRLNHLRNHNKTHQWILLEEFLTNHSISSFIFSLIIAQVSITSALGNDTKKIVVHQFTRDEVNFHFLFICLRSVSLMVLGNNVNFVPIFWGWGIEQYILIFF